MRFDVHVRIHVRQSIEGRLQLAATEISRSVQKLALQIALVDDIVIHDPDRADPGRRQIQGKR